MRILVLTPSSRGVFREQFYGIPTVSTFRPWQEAYTGISRRAQARRLGHLEAKGAGRRHTPSLVHCSVEQRRPPPWDRHRPPPGKRRKRGGRRMRKSTNEGVAGQYQTNSLAQSLDQPANCTSPEFLAHQRETHLGEIASWLLFKDYSRSCQVHPHRWDTKKFCLANALPFCSILHT